MKIDFVVGGVDSSSEESNFMNKKKFTKMVEDAVKKKSMSYMDAVVHLCDDNQLEIEDVKKYIATSVKEKIEMEAMKLNYLERGESLPDTK
jgi:gas vesicle protein